MGFGEWEGFSLSGVGGVSGVIGVVPCGRGSPPLVFVSQIGGTTGLGILAFWNLGMLDVFTPGVKLEEGEMLVEQSSTLWERDPGGGVCLGMLVPSCLGK